MIVDTSDKALLARADRLDAEHKTTAHLAGVNAEQVSTAMSEAAAALRAIVAERQPQPTGDVIETLARTLWSTFTRNDGALWELAREDVRAYWIAKATALLAQIAPALRAEGMKMAAGQLAKWLDASDWQTTEGPYSWKNNVCEHGNHGYAGCEACMEDGLSEQISAINAEAQRLREGGEG